MNLFPLYIRALDFFDEQSRIDEIHFSCSFAPNIHKFTNHKTIAEQWLFLLSERQYIKP